MKNTDVTIWQRCGDIWVIERTHSKDYAATLGFNLIGCEVEINDRIYAIFPYGETPTN